MTYWSQRKGEDLHYLLPKEEEIVVEIKSQVREQVRKLAHALDPQLLSLKRIGLGRLALRTKLRLY
jgi:16S rRNA U516 pseudouridylate synthase RsuA-like enzyme